MAVDVRLLVVDVRLLVVEVQLHMMDFDLQAPRGGQAKTNLKLPQAWKPFYWICYIKLIMIPFLTSFRYLLSIDHFKHKEVGADDVLQPGGQLSPCC